MELLNLNTTLNIVLSILLTISEILSFTKSRYNGIVQGLVIKIQEASRPNSREVSQESLSRLAREPAH